MAWVDQVDCWERERGGLVGERLRRGGEKVDGGGGGGRRVGGGGGGAVAGPMVAAV